MPAFPNITSIKAKFRQLWPLQRTQPPPDVPNDQGAEPRPARGSFDSFDEPAVPHVVPPLPDLPPPPPEKIIEEREQYRQRLDSIPYLYLRPELGQDWPLYALYRIYEWVVLSDNIRIRNELETFWFHKWLIVSIPDPEDHEEPSRYALLAGITALMVTSYNCRISLGIPRWAGPILSDAEDEEAKRAPKVWEVVPEWAKNVKPLDTTLRIPYGRGEVLESFEDKRCSRELMEKNILCGQPDIHFI